MKKKKIIILLSVIIAIMIIFVVAIFLINKENNRKEIENAIKNSAWKIKITNNQYIGNEYYFYDNYIIKYVNTLKSFPWEYNTTIYYYDNNNLVEEIKSKLSNYEKSDEDVLKGGPNSRPLAYIIEEKEDNLSYEIKEPIEDIIVNLLDKSYLKKNAYLGENQNFNISKSNF